MSGASRSCLLVLPKSFYSFTRVFSDALAECGYAVTLANDEYPENPFGKVLAKLDLPMARWWTRRTISRRFLAGRRWDLVMIIKGRGITPRLVAEMKHHAGRVVGYQFDSLDYDRALRRWTGAVDRMTTFDYRDAAAEGWPVAELFSTQPSPEAPVLQRHRVSAILRNHSRRLAYVDAVLRAIGEEGSFVYIYEKSRLSFVLNALRTPGLYWRRRNWIHFRPLPYDRYIAALAGSDFTIDYAHPKQSGATMRAFEALAMGVKLISNNGDMRCSRFFGSENCVIQPEEGDAGVLRAEVMALAGARPLMHRRSPVDLVLEIVGEGAATGQGG
ncbi:hypothetical protein [Sphingomonas sp. MMS24-J13]|uniref:glycosyltransferase family protein n=1 Tax=Sphingomonas sp. MMS24-J13 TaxID=3238686 RepID=UPI00384EC262